MDSSTNVKVALRVRPLLGSERVNGSTSIVQVSYSDPNEVALGTDRSFKFDYVFGSNSTQSDVYNSCVSVLVDTFLDGKNATIFAYGQTVCFLGNILILAGKWQNIFHGYFRI